MVTVWLLNDDEAFAVNVAAANPELTLTDAGTDRSVEPEVRTIVSPALAPLSATVHVDDADGPIDAGLHAIAETVTGGPVTLTVLPFPLTAVALPSAAAPIAPTTLTAQGALPGVNVTKTVATTPLAIGVTFIPDAIHK